MSESMGVGLKGLSQDTQQKGSWAGSQELWVLLPVYQWPITWS